jgi:hypothetical protein
MAGRGEAVPTVNVINKTISAEVLKVKSVNCSPTLGARLTAGRGGPFKVRVLYLAS